MINSLAEAIHRMNSLDYSNTWKINPRSTTNSTASESNCLRSELPRINSPGANCLGRNCPGAKFAAFYNAVKIKILRNTSNFASAYYPPTPRGE